MGNPYDVLKVLLEPPYGPKGHTKVPYGPIILTKKYPSSSLKSHLRKDYRRGEIIKYLKKKMMRYYTITALLFNMHSTNNFLCTFLLMGCRRWHVPLIKSVDFLFVMSNLEEIIAYKVTFKDVNNITYLCKAYILPLMEIHKEISFLR